RLDDQRVSEANQALHDESVARQLERLFRHLFVRGPVFAALKRRGMRGRDAAKIIAALFLTHEDRNMSRFKRFADPDGDRFIKMVNTIRRASLLAEIEEDAVFVVRRRREIPLQ